MGQNQSCPTLQEQWDKLSVNEKKEIYLRSKNVLPICDEALVASVENMPPQLSPVSSLEMSPARVHTPPSRPPPPAPDRPVSPPPLPQRPTPIQRAPIPPPMSTYGAPKIDLANSLRGPAMTPHEAQNVDPRNDESEILKQRQMLKPATDRVLSPKPVEQTTLFTALGDAVKKRRDSIDGDDEQIDTGVWNGGSAIYHGPYYVKYMKYKNKYLALRNSMK